MRLFAFSLSLFIFPAFSLAQGDPPSAKSPSLPFKISPETTYITEPLTKEGLPDYRSALNQIMKGGVTPETNAAVYYWRAMGPHPDGLDSDKFIENLKAELGTDPFSENGSHFVRYKPQNIPENEQNINDPFAEYQAAIDAPWKSNDYPSVKKWIEINQQPMEIVLEGTRQPHYYRPIIQTTEGEPLLATLLPDVQSMRELARYLSARTMLAIGEERYEDASNDLIALHRLARHVGQGATIIESLVGIAIDFLARDGDMELANAKSITVEQLKAHQKQLAELSTLAPCEQAFLTERLFGLDSIQLLATVNPKSDQGQTTLAFLGLDQSSPLGQMMTTLFRNSIDWNIVFTGLNEYHDKLQEAKFLESFAKRHAATKTLSEELKAEVEQANRPAAITFSALFSPQRRGDHIRIVLLSLLAPALEHVTVVQARGQSNAPLTETAFAVAIYQKREGTFPERLEELVPSDLAKIPLDPFTGQSVKYLLRNGEARIYVTGDDLQDHQGVTMLENREAHDIVVQVQKQEPGN